jgi:hypothetical protein
MRWERLFDELSQRYEQLADEEADSELPERTRLEYGSVELLERLAGAGGQPIRLHLLHGGVVSGTLRRLGPDWLLVTDAGAGELIIAADAVVAIEGLTRSTGEQLTPVEARYDLRKLVRAVGRARSGVELLLRSELQLSGTVDRVGADFLELAIHAPWEARRHTAVRSVVVVPLRGICSMRAVSGG